MRARHRAASRRSATRSVEVSPAVPRL
jgi:hypothetical protein